MSNMMDFVKPFNRFMTAAGTYGIFLRDEYAPTKCSGYYFELTPDGSTWVSIVNSGVGTEEHWRVVKIWNSQGGSFITENFDYSVKPVWEEKSEKQRKVAQEIEKLEQTIAQSKIAIELAQEQLQQLKKEMQ